MLSNSKKERRGQKRERKKGEEREQRKIGDAKRSGATTHALI